MNAVNFNAEMENVIEKIRKDEQKHKLLLHACCAPCASACIERVKDFFDTVVFFYNPNMDSEEEYARRANEMKRISAAFNIGCVINDYNPEEFYFAVKGLENEREGGARCAVCFYLRLKKTAEYALKNGFEYFTTTLTVSPLKNADKLNAIGKAVGNEVGVKFLPSDFKKKNGYKRSIDLSKEYGLYRQNYCGCEFSKR